MLPLIVTSVTVLADVLLTIKNRSELVVVVVVGVSVVVVVVGAAVVVVVASVVVVVVASVVVVVVGAPVVVVVVIGVPSHRIGAAVVGS